MTCPAAHPEDRRPCDGPTDAVRITDSTGTETLGCIRHGAALLASMDGARVHPGPGDTGNAAITTYKRAAKLRPFDFSTDPED